MHCNIFKAGLSFWTTGTFYWLVGSKSNWYQFDATDATKGIFDTCITLLLVSYGKWNLSWCCFSFRVCFSMVSYWKTAGVQLFIVIWRFKKTEIKITIFNCNFFHVCTPLFSFIISTTSSCRLLCVSQKHIFLPELLDEILSLLDDIDGDLQRGLLLLAEAFDQILYSFHRFGVHVVQQLLLQLLQPSPELCKM